MKTFTVNGVKYRVKIVPTTSKSNYNHFAHIFKVGDKEVYYGYAIKETTTIEEVISHAKISIPKIDAGL